MKKIVLLIAALLPAPAMAQQPMTFDNVNCSLLKGKTSVCIVNNTGAQVTDITCDWKGFWGGTKSKDIALPKGGVAAHSVTIVDMQSCKTTLVFVLPGGKTRSIPNIDTDALAVIEVPEK